MHAGGAVVQEERLPRSLLRLDEVHRIRGKHVVELSHHLDVDLLDLLDAAALLRPHEILAERQVAHERLALGLGDDVGVEVRVAPLGIDVGHRQEPVELVEAHVLRLRLHVLAHVPLAHADGAVAGLREKLRDRDLALEPPAFAGHRRAQQAVPHGQAAGHDRGTSRRAARLGIGGRELEAFAGQPIHVRRRRTHRHAAPVHPEVAPADVVHDEHEHIGPAAGALHERVELALRVGELRGMHQHGLAVLRHLDHRLDDGIVRRPGIAAGGDRHGP